jgi:hypothetical protein
MILPNADKSASREKCRAIYWTALTALPDFHGGGPRDDPREADAAVRYLREFEQTRRCDQYTSFAADRIDMASALPDGTQERVHAFTETEQDRRWVHRKVWWYREWHQRRLLQALPLQDRLYYHTVCRAGHWAAWLWNQTGARSCLP